MTSAKLSDFEGTQHLAPAERDAYIAVRVMGEGVREYQRRQGYSSPGTVSNLLASAEEKMDEGAT